MVPLTALPESERGQSLGRFHILMPFLEDGVPLPRISEESGIPLRTLRRWVSRYRSGHLAGLARQLRADRGHHRLPAQLERFIEGLALQKPRRSVAAIHRQAVAVAEQQGWSQPGYDQVYAVVRQLDPGLVSLAHEGTKGYQRAFDLIHRREASRPNEIWQADHSQLDICLLDERGESARPWLTAILDDYNRALAGYYLTFSAPSSLGTALALHQAIWRKGDPPWQVCGIPDTFYTDHGPDFTSRHMEQVAVDIEMGLVFSEGGQPRGRGKIEWFFGTVNQLFLSDLPGYAPAGSGDVRRVLTLPELDSRFRAWLLDTYHTRVHGETGQAPSDRWGAGGFLRVSPPGTSGITSLDFGRGIICPSSPHTSPLAHPPGKQLYVPARRSHPCATFPDRCPWPCRSPSRPSKGDRSPVSCTPWRSPRQRRCGMGSTTAPLACALSPILLVEAGCEIPASSRGATPAAYTSPRQPMLWTVGWTATAAIG